jgi:HK97 family phage prohead protease
VEEEMAQREIRYIKSLSVEKRNGSTGIGGEMALVGYAALYNSASKDLGGFRETIAPGTFARSLREGADVKALFNHIPDNILGRTKSGTLTLSSDDRGLRWRCQLDPKQQRHVDIYRSVERGDIDECSFAFTVAPGGQQWSEGPEENGQPMYKRLLTDVDLLDVSCVTYPAYNSTSVDARNRCFPEGDQEVRSAIEQLIKSKRKDRLKEAQEILTSINGGKKQAGSEAVEMLRRAARAMSPKLRDMAGDEMALVRDHLQACHEAMENAFACSDTARQISDAYDVDDSDEDDEYKSAYRSFRIAHRDAHDALNKCCERMAATRLAQPVRKKK